MGFKTSAAIVIFAATNIFLSIVLTFKTLGTPLFLLFIINILAISYLALDFLLADIKSEMEGNK